MVKKIYKPVFGASFDKKKAQIYGECLDKIAEERGRIKPLDVVDEARNPKSPLHSYFNWDDEVAAEKYRINQARDLIRHITVVIKYDHKVKEQKAFFSIQQTPGKDNKNTAYVTIDRVLTEPELKEQVINNALKELDYWEKKYNEYKALSGIFRAIDREKRKIKRKKKK